MQATFESGKVVVGRALRRMAFMMNIPVVHSVVATNSAVYQFANFLTTVYL